MLDAFLTDNGGFSNYSIEHGICFILIIYGIFLTISKGKNNWDSDKQRLYITIICSLGALSQLFKVFYRLYAGVFDITADLPLHLCNLMTIVMPFIVWYKNRFFWSLTFFWIMAGCAQSIFTPTLTETLPHYEAVRYWLVHGVIILGALYGWLVYGYHVTIKDAFISMLGLNVLAAVMYPINVLLGANYMYLNAKPPGTTFYDLLGAWPHYIWMLEFVVLLFFGILLLPFHLKTRSNPKKVKAW